MYAVHLFSTAGMATKGHMRPRQRVECKNFYIDDLYSIYFLLPRSAKHFTKDTAFSQSLQSKGSIWQMCELQHFIRQERTKKVQGVDSIGFAIIYLLLKHFQWSHSESCNENCIWSKTNLNERVPFGDGSLCPDGYAIGSRCGTDIFPLWKDSLGALANRPGAWCCFKAVTASVHLEPPRKGWWWIFIFMSFDSEIVVLLSSSLHF